MPALAELVRDQIAVASSDDFKPAVESITQIPFKYEYSFCYILLVFVFFFLVLQVHMYSICGCIGGLRTRHTTRPSKRGVRHERRSDLRRWKNATRSRRTRLITRVRRRSNARMARVKSAAVEDACLIFIRRRVIRKGNRRTTEGSRPHRSAWRRSLSQRPSCPSHPMHRLRNGRSSLTRIKHNYHKRDSFTAFINNWRQSFSKLSLIN